jgi:acetolactate decarboxylase
MRSLTVKVPDEFWEALERRRREHGEPIEHVVRAALADYLQLEHQTLFQVSTATALVEGIYRGAVTVGQLKTHGDLGLGTFEGVDGELVMVDGRVYQVRADGACHEVDDAALSPFAVVTHFQAEHAFALAECADLAALTAQLDRRRESDNVFYAVRIDGAFTLLHTRSMCKSAEGVPLAAVAAHQPEFALRAVSATVVGFWSPDYAKTIEVPGWHLHAVTDDRRAGGHVLGCRAAGLRAQLQQLTELRVALPSTAEFLRADLTRDASADLEEVERERSS